MKTKQIKASDQRIKTALETLQSHERGRAALQDFKRLVEGPARGLDTAGLYALRMLLSEFIVGRRDFVKDIPTGTAGKLQALLQEWAKESVHQPCSAEDVLNWIVTDWATGHKSLSDIRQGYLDAVEVGQVDF